MLKRILTLGVTLISGAFALQLAVTSANAVLWRKRHKRIDGICTRFREQKRTYPLVRKRSPVERCPTPSKLTPNHPAVGRNGSLCNE